MKTILASAAFVFSFATPLAVHAAADHSGHGGHQHAHAAAPAESPLIDGVVKKVDAAAGKVTVSHGPLPNGMPAMTMAFKAQEAAWLKQVKAGDKIRFRAQEIDGTMTLMQLEPVK